METRKEFLNHVIVKHLRKLSDEYFHYNNNYRTYLGLTKNSPESRLVHAIGKIEKVPDANDLHNYYFSNAA